MRSHINKSWKYNFEDIAMALPTSLWSEKPCIQACDGKCWILIDLFLFCMEEEGDSLKREQGEKGEGAMGIASEGGWSERCEEKEN